VIYPTKTVICPRKTVILPKKRSDLRKKHLDLPSKNGGFHQQRLVSPATAAGVRCHQQSTRWGKWKIHRLHSAKEEKIMVVKP
jgi:hypothetical protein